MKKTFVLSGALILCVGWLASRTLDVVAVARSAGSQEQAGEAGAAIVAAAKDLLASLDENQSRKVSFAYDDEERFNWHFIPRDRKGVALNELNETQKGKVKALLQSGLSNIGYKRAEQVRVLEGVLRDIEGANRRFSRDPELYFVSVFGHPAAKGRWGWRFEGHHLCLNFTLDGTRLLSATPLMYGANPAKVLEGPNKGLRVLAGMEDIARKLVTSLDDEQRKTALGEGKPEEVKSTTSRRYKDALPDGLTAEKMNEEQRPLLRELINEYAKNLKRESRRKLRRGIRQAGRGQIHFAWRGGLKAGEGHSYMIHGPEFVISYANFQGGATHIHAALRNTAGEFGLEAKASSSN